MKNFEEIINSEEKVMIKFGASWCGPCKVMDRRLEYLIYDKLNVHKVDVEEFTDLGSKMSIRNLPTTIIFQKGEIIDRFSGLLTVEQLRDKIK
jgi:thioredoxin 1